MVVYKGRSLLEPFPSLAAQTIGDCNALQSVGTFRVDRSTGMMWVMDEGRVNGLPVCPAKLVVINMADGKLHTRHIFPRDVYDRIRGNIADIAFAQENGRTRFVFLSELNLAQLIVYDIVKDKSWSFKEKKKEIWPSPMTKTPHTNRKFENQRTTHTNATKNFDYTTIADRIRTVSWSNK